MDYFDLQTRIYDNKAKRGFNVQDVGKEVILMSEEFGELCDSYLKNDKDSVVDAIGDLMVYCLGLCAMFKWDSNELVSTLNQPPGPKSLAESLPYMGMELGMIAKTFKKSNKQQVDGIDNKDLFRIHIGNLMGYCIGASEQVKSDIKYVLETIVKNNEGRTHGGKI